VGLRAVTYLGANTGPILRELTRYIRAATGLDIEADPSARTSRDALHGDTEDLGDLVWACGHLTTELIAARVSNHGAREVVASPVFAGQSEPIYHAVIVVREDGPDDLRSAMSTRLGINEVESWSGHLGLAAHVAGRGISGWFDNVTVTGSHLDSIAALGSRRVDVISVDHTVWESAELAESAETDLRDLRVLERTRDWPAPPFSVRTDLDRGVRDELVAALMSLPGGEVDGLDAIRSTQLSDYHEMRSPLA
jgi:ABC-type phosphate/phosphonate transport system substrate-binding protein